MRADEFLGIRDPFGEIPEFGAIKRTDLLLAAFNLFVDIFLPFARLNLGLERAARGWLPFNPRPRRLGGALSGSDPTLHTRET